MDRIRRPDVRSNATYRKLQIKQHFVYFSLSETSKDVSLLVFFFFSNFIHGNRSIHSLIDCYQMRPICLEFVHFLGTSFIFRHRFSSATVGHVVSHRPVQSLNSVPVLHTHESVHDMVHIRCFPYCNSLKHVGSEHEFTHFTSNSD